MSTLDYDALGFHRGFRLEGVCLPAAEAPALYVAFARHATMRVAPVSVEASGDDGPDDAGAAERTTALRDAARALLVERIDEALAPAGAAP